MGALSRRLTRWRNHLGHVCLCMNFEVRIMRLKLLREGTELLMFLQLLVCSMLNRMVSPMEIGKVGTSYVQAFLGGS